jgi:Cdc6-like AAA superfamily ATPase
LSATEAPRVGDVLLCSSLPDKTDYFVGRESKLLKLQGFLNHVRPGRKTTVVVGIGGSGKTQLVLEHIRKEGSQYSAIVWINVWTPYHAKICLDEPLSTMSL